MPRRITPEFAGAMTAAALTLAAAFALVSCKSVREAIGIVAPTVVPPLFDVFESLLRDLEASITAETATQDPNPAFRATVAAQRDILQAFLDAYALRYPDADLQGVQDRIDACATSHGPAP